MDKERSEIILYEAPNGQTKIDVLFEGETVWLNQQQISAIFERDRTVITRHIGNIFAEGELDEKSNVQKMHFANSDKLVAFYSLDVNYFRRLSGKQSESDSVSYLGNKNVTRVYY